MYEPAGPVPYAERKYTGRIRKRTDCTVKGGLLFSGDGSQIKEDDPRQDRRMFIDLAGVGFTIQDIAGICGGSVTRDGIDSLRVCSVCTDSREAVPGCLFLALRGVRSDGHRYISVAAEKGAAAVLCEEMPAEEIDIPAILVPNTVEALGKLAKAHAEKSAARRVAVTGSVGKTTTKEMIAGVLSYKKCFRTTGNFNSVIGMPMSLLTLPADSDFAVFELGLVFDVGFRDRGQIAHMSGVVSPEIAVVTNVGSSHLEHFSGRKELIDEKLSVAEGLSADGTLLLPASLYKEAGDRTGKWQGRHVRTFSVTGEAADYSAVRLAETSAGQTFDMIGPDGHVLPLSIGLYGIHNVQAALIAAAVGTMEGIPDAEIQKALAAYTPFALRQEVQHIGAVTLILDCYNASPESMRAACGVLTGKSVRAARTVALLGDMLELGPQSEQMHYDTGRYFAEHGLDYLLAFGERAAKIAEGAAETMPADRILRFPDKENAAAPAEWLYRMLRPGDALLIKASRGMAAERIRDVLAEKYRDDKKKST